MNRVVPILVAVALLESAAVQLLGQAPPPLQSPDFEVAGIDLDADSTTVIQRLGRPDSSRTEAGFGVDEHSLRYWYFPGAAITFRVTDVVEGILLTTPTYATTRGLRVGDLRERVRTLYGSPLDDPDPTLWLYADDPRLPEHLIIMTFSGDAVTSISVRHFRA